jgi:hypothetical protein
MTGWPKASDANCRRRTLKPSHEHRRTPYQIQPPLFWYIGRTALRLARGRRRFPVPSPCRAVHQRSALRSSASRGLANSLGPCQRMAAQAGMSDPRRARPKRVASVSGDDALCRGTRERLARDLRRRSDRHSQGCGGCHALRLRHRENASSGLVE